ncbi:hypothetical protein NE237_028417 [Protea cynaroides]|uniref:Transposase-associated domain-containing protein n=1 Tax=Protea cynaroides TaxID=273540 RepID=A0A9Q0GQ95_9MAGN|nr:hypothetical protein NE237_028417 [Protea cynaroides]
MDRSWIQKSWNRRFRLSELYAVGVNGFLEFAFSRVSTGDRILCPCIYCINQQSRTREEVYEHLIVDGIIIGYTRWYCHGEFGSSNPTSTDSFVVDEEDEEDIVDVHDILQDAFPEHVVEGDDVSSSTGGTEGIGDKGSTSHGPSTSQTSTEPRRKRGCTRAIRTNNRSGADQILTVNVNHLGQVFGPHRTELSTYLGTLARNPTRIPLNFDDWRKVPINYKEQAWNSVLEKFNFDGNGKRQILKMLGHTWRDYKWDLRKRTIERFPNLKDAPRPISPIEIPEDQWKSLIDRWTSHEWMAKAQKNKQCREKQNLPHTAGRTSFPQVSYLMSNEMLDGREPSRLELFKKTHKRKDGSCEVQAAMEVIEKLEEKLDEQPPQLRDNKSVQDDIFVQVMGPESRNHVCGTGRGVSPCDLGLTQRNLQKKKENEEFRSTVSTMQENITTLKAQLTELDQIKAQLAILTQIVVGENCSQSSIQLFVQLKRQSHTNRFFSCRMLVGEKLLLLDSIMKVTKICSNAHEKKCPCRFHGEGSLVLAMLLAKRTGASNPSKIGCS